MKRQTSEFRAARWSEPLIAQLSAKDEIGVIPPCPDDRIAKAIGDPLTDLPTSALRRDTPALPEVSQARVLRHYSRLSQMTMGVDTTVDVMGTCTMKYSPKVHEAVANAPQIRAVHPLQPPSSMQGLLGIMHAFAGMMAEIAGMDEVTFQAGSGAQGIYTNARMIRAYHERRGKGKQRDEIITTSFSHPVDAAAPAVAGFRVLTLMPGPSGYADLDALKAVVSERTAGLMLANPEDTGIFNPHIKEMVDLVHGVGGLCAYDQANGNGLLGILRAGDAGFDLCQFNLHKTFSAPHSSTGQGCAAVGVKKHLKHLLPRPLITESNGAYGLDFSGDQSIGRIRAFYGNVQTVLKAYMWVLNLGSEGLRAVAETAVLNNNYLVKKLGALRGVDIPWPSFDKHRMEQTRYSLEQLFEETGITSAEINNRLVDYGLQNYIESHVPMLVPQPFTLEPGETYTADELDECVEALATIINEAYTNPNVIRQAPARASVEPLETHDADDPERWAFTWRAWVRKNGDATTPANDQDR